MSIKFLVLGGGEVFWVWGGGVPIFFLWARGFSENWNMENSGAVADIDSTMEFLLNNGRGQHPQREIHFREAPEQFKSRYV